MSENTMKIKIFWQKNCPHCPEAKNIGKQLEKEIEVQYFDIESVDGLAEASYYNIASTPSVVALDNNENEIEIWRGKTPRLEEIRKEAAI
jgi:glutaredoxin